jgi:uncharacterized CHY-type Zn-finger protein
MKALEHTHVTLLTILIAGGLFLLFNILLGRAGHTTAVQGGRVAHGPAEFAAVFEDPLLAPLSAAELAGQAGGHIPVPPPPFSKDMWPCSECHKDLETHFKPHKMDMAHEQIVLEHGGEIHWCFECHNPEDLDKLRLANGTLIGFNESYRLCGQCHGEIYRDWRDGIHGRRTGNWDGAKRYLLCAHCHDPHSPRFKPLAPLPPPVRPDFLRK